MRRLLVIASAILGAAAGLPVLGAQPPADFAAVHRLSGCYRLTLGPWSGRLPTDLAAAQTPPARFRLDTVALSGQFADWGYAVQPRELWRRPRGVRPAAWRPLGGDSLTLFWTTGYSGVRLGLRARGDTLVGGARTFRDAYGAGEPPDREASVTAVRIQCDAEVGRPSARVDTTPRNRSLRIARFEPVQPELLSLGGALVNAWADFDADGDLDLFVGFNGSAPNRLYRNDQGVLTDASAAAGVADARPTRAVAWGDFDADGDPDLLVGFAPGAGPVLKLYRNDHARPGSARFADVTATTGVARDSGAVRQLAWVDVDDDGDLDLFVAFRDRANALFRNEHTRAEGTRFRDVAPEVGLADTRRSVGAVWLDYDEDGDLDLYVGNMDGHANGLFRNDGTRSGDTRFVDVAAEVGLAWGGRLPNEPANGTVRPCAADVNGDGRLDLFTANYGKNGLFLNRGRGSFEDVSGRWGVDIDGRYDSCAFGDVDHDGRLDLYVNGTVTGGVSYPDYLFLNRGDRFEDATTPDMRSLHADHGVQWADYDGDGDVDLALTGARPDGMHLLLRNTLPPERASRSLRILVLDSAGRATRAGAEVRLFAASTRRLLGTRLVDSGSGYDSQSEMPVHFGLATLAPVDVEVTWPSGGKRATTWRRGVNPREWGGRVLVVHIGRP